MERLVFYGNCFFCRSSLRLKGHPRPVVRSTENSANPSIQRGVCAYSNDVNPVFKKSFCQGPSIGPDLGYIYDEIGFRNFTQISLATIAFRIRTPDFIKNSIVELSFQIGFLGQEQPSTESAQIFKDCRSDHMGMGLG